MGRGIGGVKGGFTVGGVGGLPTPASWGWGEHFHQASEGGGGTPPAHSLGVGFLNPMPCVWDCFYTVQKITTVPSAGHCGVGF